MAAQEPRAARLAGFIALAALVLTPLFAFLWEVLNDLLNGHADGRRLLAAVAVLVVFAALARLLARAVERLEAPADAGPLPPRERR